MEPRASVARAYLTTTRLRPTYVAAALVFVVGGWMTLFASALLFARLRRSSHAQSGRDALLQPHEDCDAALADGMRPSPEFSYRR